jgi:hypothetical protein
VEDVAGPGLGVEPLGVSLFAHSQIGGAVNLKKVARRDQGAGAGAIGAERRDEGGEGDHTGIEEQLGHFTDPADVLDAVVVGEAKVVAEPMADVVAVEQVGGQAPAEQLPVHRIGECALAGT